MTDATAWSPFLEPEAAEGDVRFTVL